MEPVNSRRPKISIIIPVYNAAHFLPTCLRAVKNNPFQNYECWVVDDASTDNSAAVAESFGVRVLRLEANHGPAYARNRGAEVASGEILFFVDSDVCLSSTSFQQVADYFDQNPQSDALFGSYDEKPASPDFFSQYKNLLHHYTHQQARVEASTFWAGCGAIRREAFLRMSGFDESFRRPSVEDIELGQRLRAAGHRVVVCKDLQVKHLKTWSLWGLIKTDMLDRGIPWTMLILRDRNFVNDLNLHISQRISVFLSYFILLCFGIGAFLLHGLTLLYFLGALGIVLLFYWFHDLTDRRENLTLAAINVFLLGSMGLITIYFQMWILLPFLALASIILINYHFYAFLLSQRSARFALMTIPLHILYFLYNGVSFLLGIILFFWKRKSVPSQPDRTRFQQQLSSPKARFK